jgi:hypothetical protein
MHIPQSSIKVCGPYVVIVLSWTLVFDKYLAWLVVMNMSRCDWTMILEHKHHSRPNRDYDWEGICIHYREGESSL